MTQRLLLCGFLVLAACTREASTGQAQVPPQGTPAPLPEVLATVGGQPVTLGDVRARAGQSLAMLDAQYERARYQIVAAALDSILGEKTLVPEARRRGISVDSLIAIEAGRPLAPSDAEVTAWFQENQARLGGRPLEQLRPQIVNYLQAQRREAASQKLEDRLRAQMQVVVKLPPYRLTFHNEKAPALGPANAPVQLVVFSDFQCPFCKGLEPALHEAVAKYPSQLRLVYRQFPLTQIHPFAQKAAEASLCAHEQGKFWAFHDALFADQEHLAVRDLKATAQRLGLDPAKFSACLDAGRYVEQVQDDQREGQLAGVNGTPAVFLNGVPLEGGAVTFPVLDAAIQKELAAGSRKP